MNDEPPPDVVIEGVVGYYLDVYKVPRDFPVVIAKYQTHADAHVIDEWEPYPVTGFFKLWRGDRPTCEIEAKCAFARVRREVGEWYDLQVLSRPGTDLIEIIRAFEGHFGPADSLLSVAKAEDHVYAPGWSGLCLIWKA